MKRVLMVSILVFVLAVSSVFAFNLGKQKCWYLIQPAQQVIGVKACVPVCIDPGVLDPGLYQKLVALYQEAVAKGAHANFLSVLQILIAQHTNQQIGVVPAASQSQYFYTHTFSDKLDNWAFYRAGQIQSWQHVTSGKTRYLQLNATGSAMIQAEKIIPIPAYMKGKAVVVTASVMVDLKAAALNSPTDFAAAGVVAHLYNRDYTAYSELPPSQAKAVLWSTSEYPTRHSSFLYPDEEIIFASDPYRTLTGVNIIFWPDVTANMECVKIGLIAFGEGDSASTQADIWISDVRVMLADAEYR
ncbi:MAG TPA: hypothetical protein PLB79_01025 [Thermotogota bacterium]|jgi:hypothetical protein|nr:hypothetical protein [Thermotogota bacterium]OQC31969.1 MAG: hypothetical protein BWX67_00738 [Thermotogota bacterium ADurb.Bin062]HNW47540.1 hypothetical protein [Thermotogota bacterium]HNY81404.1 hypothetical protein [Thermotogota bacterium]HOD91279.1 hypothetical protein [Thermotogota bacterium]